MKSWVTGKSYFGTLPNWVIDEDDKNRLATYELYENIYRNVPEIFKLNQRGEDSAPIYLPSARTIVEATNRFLAVDWDFVVSPAVGTEADQNLSNVFLRKLFRREQFYTKFATQRRWGLIRGDQIWHIIGDPKKPVGSRISIHELDPSQYFPITDPDNIERTIGCHIVSLVPDPADKTKVLARRQTYRKAENGRITSSLGLFEIDKWDDRNLEPADIVQKYSIVQEFELNPLITALPVYHIKNSRVPGLPFGASEFEGMERVIAAANQAISDEELALAIQGLGMFWTTSGPPVDEDGNEVAWEIGPKRVIEVPPGETFDRVEGVNSVTPMLDHIRFLQGDMSDAAGIPDIARGKVDVTVAESGISLALQLSPLLAKNSEKESEILGVIDHMLYDLIRAWGPAFQEINSGMITEIVSAVGDPLPKNRKASIDEIIQLVNANLMSVEEGREELLKWGYEFSSPNIEKIAAEQRALAEAKNFDPLANRYASELDEMQGNASGAGSSGTIPARNGITPTIITS